MPEDRVLIVGPVSPPLGGMAVYTTDLLGSRIRDHFRMHLVPSNLIRKDLATGAMHYILASVNAMLLLARFVVALCVIRPAIVHIHTNSYTGFYEKSLLTLIAKLCRRRVAMHVHGGAFAVFYAQSSRCQRWLIRTCLKPCDRVVVLSARFRATIVDLGIPPSRVVALYNAVYVPSPITSVGNDSRASEPPAGTLTILFLNRIERLKGIYELVAAARAICARADGARFLIVGPDSPDRTRVADIIQDAELQARIILAQAVEGREKDAAFRSADIYVLPSHVEGLPIGLLEAMSYGLACIATPVGAVPEVVVDRENGLLVPPGDIDALTNALAQLVECPELRRSLGRAARETVVKRFSWEQRADELGALYRDILTNPREARRGSSDQSLPGTQAPR